MKGSNSSPLQGVLHLKFGMVVWATATLAFSSIAAVCAQSQSDFGTPPSGAVPILFNDRHVYAKPDALVRGRLVVAYVRGTSVYVPLRAMIEQLGGDIAYDPDTKAITVRKSGVTLALTIGKPQATIDGEVRPLDVPPMIIGGDIMVPLRVIAETLGAYVAYLPNIHAVVVRYVPAPGVAPAAPSSSAPYVAPSPASSPHPRATVPPGPPIPISTPQPETYVVVDVAIAPRVSNEYAHGSGNAGSTFGIRAATEFSLIDTPFEADAEYTQWSYAHPAGYVNNVGNTGSAPVPAFSAIDRDLEFHLGAQLTPHKYYVAIGYATFGNNYGYPRTSGIGAGLEKLPVLENRLSYDGSLMYYPNVSGACNAACPPGADSFSYEVFTYQAGLTYEFGNAFLDGSYRGDLEYRKAEAPADATHSGVFVGLGLHF